MLLHWFDTREVISYAKEIAQKIEGLRISASKAKSHAKAQKNAFEKHERLLAEVGFYAAHHRLNIYKRAKFLNTVKWELREHGSDDVFIDKIISLLAVALNNGKVR